ncbi:macro domain-containing protein [Crenobacter intestini]|uniref:Thoeris protein ThsA Macro domain-containing protein n=1 Tax=Crenobacter intestini TaxID=2563443 RepID=A0A4T0V5B1_9NEIS|nr:macro domain-containing protein [Crenobacter intestini]TIC86924.1 hypothetical protein E5K04_00475 [Crenobacter intestini]
MKILHNIYLGIKRHPLKFLVEIFFAYSALWTLVESGSYFFQDIKPQGILCYLVLVFIGILAACIRAYQHRSFSFKISHSNTEVTVSFGDLFDHGGYLAIPVNEFFDSKLGLPVSPKSLHGIVVDKFFGGHPTSFDQLLTVDLANTPGQDIQRANGKTRRYPIGTTASINTNSHRFLLFALCTTDIVTFKASATIPDLVRALEGLCARARVVLGGERLIIPLVGSGLSGIGLPANQLLQLILLVLVNETKKNQVALDIEIVIHPDRFDEIDFHLIENFWR